MKKKYSSFESVGMNLYYIKDYPININTGKPKIIPQTYAMEWAMRVTGINRLFSKDDIYELLLRLSIVLDSNGIIEDWFNNDKLLSFTISNAPYLLTIEDVFFHFGLEISNDIENKKTRKLFYKTIDSGFFVESMMISFGSPFKLIGYSYSSDHNKEIVNILKNGIPKETINKAIAFADYLIKLAPENAFEITEAMKEKLQELSDRKLRMETIPVFDVLNIPLNIRKQCYDIMFDIDLKESDFILSSDDKKNNEKRENEIVPFLHLAWLLANDMMVEEPPFIYPEEAVKNFDIDFFDFDGINLQITIEDYNMEECMLLLKGVGVE